MTVLLYSSCDFSAIWSGKTQLPVLEMNSLPLKKPWNMTMYTRYLSDSITDQDVPVMNVSSHFLINTTMLGSSLYMYIPNVF